jgi:hypothetical protein
VQQCIAVLEGKGEDIADKLELAGEQGKAHTLRRLVSTAGSTRLDFLGLEPEKTDIDVAALALEEGKLGASILPMTIESRGHLLDTCSCTTGVVQLMQLRGGIVRSRYSYTVQLPPESGPSDYGEAMQATLEDHYSRVHDPTEV